MPGKRPVELGIPVQLAIEETQIVDLDKTRKNKPDDVTADAASGDVLPMTFEQVKDEMEPESTHVDISPNNEISNEPSTSRQVRTDRGQKRKDTEHLKLRTKRTREELIKKRLLDSTTDDEHDRLRPAWKKNLPDSTTSDSSSEESMSVLIGIRPGCNQPRKGTAGSAAYDICAAENTLLKPGVVTPVPLNLQLALPEGTTFILKSRSGLALKDLSVEAGVIDADFRGEIKALIRNHSDTPFLIKKKQRCCQGLLIQNISAKFIQVKDESVWDTSIHQHHGFGSTGL